MSTSVELRPAPACRGVLSASSPDGELMGRRVLPSADLAPFIHHYGSVHWNLRSPFDADTLQHPAARLELHAQGRTWNAQVVGVRTRRFSMRHKASGQFFVVQFRPATFQPLLRAPLSGITDRTVPISHMFGASADRWAMALQRAHSLEENIAHTESFLRTLLPALPRTVSAMRDLIERIAADHGLCRVHQVARVAKLDMRTLQRHFRVYVGVTPKWVIQRYRMLEAAQQLRSARIPLASLAAQLGYADQAHFARDFRAVIGRTPGAFARDEAPASANV